MYSPPAQTVSWPQFRFYQVGEQWQRQWCSKLGIPYRSTYEQSIGSTNTILTRPDRQSVRVMIGDGICLFRSLSCVLTGSQRHHLLVRCLICNHMSSITHLLLPHICSSVEDYITRTKMDNNLVWGTDIEIYTFANMCQPMCMCLVFNIVLGVYSLPLCQYRTLMYPQNLCIYSIHEVIMM